MLREAGVPSSAVNDVPAALEEARLVEYEHPRARHGAPGGLAAAAVRRGAARPKPAPERGEHTEAVLVELCGYSPERVRELDGRWSIRSTTKGEADAETGAST